MPATTPEQICQLFKQYMAEGDVDALLSLYDPEAVFLNSSGEIKQGRQGLRGELAPSPQRKLSLTSASSRQFSLAILH
jgi:hypothetical protein